MAVSSHLALIRALKSPSDPPQCGGPSKLTIAWDAWNTSPNNADLIVDWILTKFLKDKSSICDVGCWTLLCNIVTQPMPLEPAKDNRALKTWILPVLSRNPIYPIVVNSLDLFTAQSFELTAIVHNTLLILWPLSVKKFNTENLLEVFVAVLRAVTRCETDGKLDRSLERLGVILINSFQTSALSSTNKKLHNAFLLSHLSTWLKCISSEGTSSVHLLIYTSGAEILFNADSLRQSPDILFNALSQANNSFVISALPRLLGSYIVATRKHRNALFVGSNVDPIHETRIAGMKFFISSQPFFEGEQSIEAWVTRSRSLSILNYEDIFIPSDEGADAEQAILRQVGSAADVLANCDGKVESLALEVLSTATKISYELIRPSLPKILSRLLLIPPTNPAFVFTDLIIEYHTKTRTVNAYISHILNAISSFDAKNTRLPVPMSALTSLVHATETNNVYQQASTSALMSLAHLDRLAKCTQLFLTQGQVSDAVKDLFAHFQKNYNLRDCGEHRPRKRQKSERANRSCEDSEQEDPELHTIRISLCARIIGVILGSLPFDSMLETTRQEILRMVADSMASLDWKKRKLHLAKDWHAQGVFAAHLRLQNSLLASQHFGPPLLENGSEIDGVCRDLLVVAEDDLSLPMLVLEIFRNRFALYMNKNLSDLREIFDAVLSYVDRHFDPIVTWSGRSCHLVHDGEGKQQSALAVFSLLLDRWLPVADQHASQEQLMLLVNLIFRSDLHSGRHEGMETTSGAIVLRCLRSAQSWELPKLRAALLSFLDTATAPVDSIDMKPGESFLQSAGPDAKSKVPELDRIALAYRILLYVPDEYLSRSARAIFTRRAVAADIFLVFMEDAEKVHCLRLFLKRTRDSAGLADHTNTRNFVTHLLISGPAKVTPELQAVTLDLIECNLEFLLKVCPESLASIVATFSEVDLFAGIGRSRCDIMRGGFARLIEVLRRDHTSSSFGEPVQAALIKLQQRLIGTLASLFQQENDVSDDMTKKSVLLTSWQHLLILGRWLELDGMPLSFIEVGEQELAKITAYAKRRDTSTLADYVTVSSSAMAVLIEELLCPNVDRKHQLEVIMAAYISLSSLIEEDGRCTLDAKIAQVCKYITPEEFSCLLNDLFARELSTPSRWSDRHLASLIRVSLVLLHDPVPGTVKVCQAFAGECLNQFAGHSVFVSGRPAARLSALEFVLKHCSERPAALRILDLNSIWSMLGKLLRKSKCHDLDTASSVFHYIVAIVGALVRLRRDLVVHTLPHLGDVLQRLISCLRSLRPQLGAIQSGLVTDTLPEWINASKQPLGAEEAKALARLFSMLTVKTIARLPLRGHHALVTTTAVDAPKAESLVKPFSKHVAYVTLAYIELMNDPLCVLPLEVRKELQPGLFALCGMLGEHDRDAVMVSALDAGGKATMKALWKEYEKQKYVGRG